MIWATLATILATAAGVLLCLRRTIDAWQDGDDEWVCYLFVLVLLILSLSRELARLLP